VLGNCRQIRIGKNIDKEGQSVNDSFCNYLAGLHLVTKTIFSDWRLYERCPQYDYQVFSVNVRVNNEDLITGEEVTKAIEGIVENNPQTTLLITIHGFGYYSLFGALDRERDRGHHPVPKCQEALFLWRLGTIGLLPGRKGTARQHYQARFEMASLDIDRAVSAFFQEL
jgi:hypothetical protein